MFHDSLSQIGSSPVSVSQVIGQQVVLTDNSLVVTDLVGELFVNVDFVVSFVCDSLPEIIQMLLLFKIYFVLF